MYAFLIGTVEEKSENVAIINVNGVGYEVWVSSFTANSLQPGETAKVYTYLHVREDAMLLYGFSTLQEKALFEDLISVSGVGSKTAIQILSGSSPQELVSSIVMGDTRTISAIKGIGKKTAERIVLELKSKLDNMDIIANAQTLQNTAVSTVSSEAVTLLINMGLTHNEATNLVKQVSEPDDTIEQIITKALRNMG